MTDTETMTASVQEKILEAVRVSQDATVKAYRTWAETAAACMPNVAELWSAPKTESIFGFADKMWTSQKDFVARLYEAAAPMTATAPDTARRAGAATAAKA
ncbi:MAG: hypothetical protein ACRD1K_08255 [Acidimicrobiales bacterium]